MPGKRWMFCAVVMGLVSSSGCCRWCERWCADRNPPVAAAGYQQCVPCCPVVCCPPGGGAPAHYPPPAAQPQGQPGWQRTNTQPVSGNCCQ